MQYEPIVSSNLKGTFHDGTDLFVLFNNGMEYRYLSVPGDVYLELRQAESAGKFLNTRIKPNYKYEKVH